MGFIYETLYRRLLRNTLIPFLLILIMPQIAIIIPYIVVMKNGSVTEALGSHWNLLKITKDAWGSVDWYDTQCWSIIFGALTWCYITLRLLPARMYYGPMTQSGYRPQYWHNAHLTYLLTMAIAIPVIFGNSMIPFYGKFVTISGMLNVLGLTFAVLLYIKGHLAPDPGFSGFSGNPIYDFFCGLEHYPCLGKYINLKVFIVNRFGHLFWQLILLAAAKGHYELHGQLNWPILVTTVEQTLYIIRALHWEDGYMAAFDTTYDSLGFGICWGMTSLVPSVYAIPSIYYMKIGARTPLDGILGPLAMCLGICAMAFGYWTDYQRQVIRDSDGHCTIWGRKPTIIRAKWIDDNGNEHNSVLLASGFWGLARHCNYTFEILIFLTSGVPALFSSPIPFCTPFFLTCLMLQRTFRNGGKCEVKYGKYWEEYCRLVPYRLIPGVF